MAKNIQISEVMVRMPNVIQVDGIIYPRTSMNIKIVKEYWETGEESILDRLSKVVLDFG